MFRFHVNCVYSVITLPHIFSFGVRQYKRNLEKTVSYMTQTGFFALLLIFFLLSALLLRDVKAFLVVGHQSSTDIDYHNTCDIF